MAVERVQEASSPSAIAPMGLPHDDLQMLVRSGVADAADPSFK